VRCPLQGVRAKEVTRHQTKLIERCPVRKVELAHHRHAPPCSASFDLDNSCFVGIEQLGRVSCGKYYLAWVPSSFHERASGVRLSRSVKCGFRLVQDGDEWSEFVAGPGGVVPSMPLERVVDSCSCPDSFCSGEVLELN
jgi:hypothetical protein